MTHTQKFCVSIFLSTLSLRRATVVDTLIFAGSMLFLSTLSLRRATRAKSGQQRSRNNFYPRSPCGERPPARMSSRLEAISIHALLAESDHRQFPCQSPEKSGFLSTLSLRRATILCAVSVQIGGFLSTLSLRRATAEIGPNLVNRVHFYPRSPCGERRWLRCWQLAARDISIHALLAESDSISKFIIHPTRNFYPRSPCGERQQKCTKQ